MWRFPRRKLVNVPTDPLVEAVLVSEVIAMAVIATILIVRLVAPALQRLLLILLVPIIAEEFVREQKLAQEVLLRTFHHCRLPAINLFGNFR